MKRQAIQWVDEAEEVEDGEWEGEGEGGMRRAVPARAR